MAYGAVRPVSCRFGDAPEEWKRALDHPAHVLAPSLITDEEAGRRVDDAIQRGFVEPADRRLLLVRRLGLVPRRHLRFDFRYVRPAEPGLVAIGAHPDCYRRIDAIRAGMPGMEHLPAALTGRRLHRAPGADRAPVDRCEVHIYPEPFEQVGGDVALRLGDRLVLSDEAGDRLARITAFGQQFLGGIELARALEDLAAFLGIERRARGEKAR